MVFLRRSFGLALLLLVAVSKHKPQCAFGDENSSPVEATEDDSPEFKSALLRQLKERDLQFDDVLFQYDKQRLEEVNLRADLLREWKNRMRRPTALRSADEKQFLERMSRIGSLPGPFPVEYASFETLTLRGSVIAFERTPETRSVANEHQNISAELDAFVGLRNTSERWSNSGDLLQSAIVNGENKFIAQATGPGSLATIDQQRMAIEFALGFGFSRRLLALDSIEEAADGGLIAEGRIRMWVDDESVCRLEIDRDLVVRKAMIHSDIEGNQHDFETNAVGTFVQSGLPVLAASGRFRKRWLGTMREGQLVGKPRDKDVIGIQLAVLEHPVTDVEFDRLTTFNVDEQTAVRDVTRDETVKSPKKAVIAAGSNSLRSSVFVANLVFVALVVFLVLYNQKCQKKSL